MEITKDQLKLILQKAPQGSDPKKIIKALQAKGNTIEGLVSQEQFKAASPLVASVAEKIGKAGAAPGKTPESIIKPDPSMLPGRSTGIARSETQASEMAGVKLPETPEEEKGYFTKIKEGIGEGVQEGYASDKANEKLFEGKNLTGAAGVLEDASAIIPKTIMQGIDKIGRPILGGIEAAFDPVIQTALDVPLPMAMMTKKDGFEYLVTPREYFSEVSSEIPDSVKEAGKQKLVELNDWYQSQPDNIKTGLKDAGVITQLVATFLGGKAAIETGKPLVKAGLGKIGNVGNSLSEKIGSMQGKAKDFLNTKAVDMLNSNIKIDPVKGAKQFYDLSGGQTHGQFLIERGIIGTPEQTIEQLTDRFSQVKNSLDDGISSIEGLYKPASAKNVLDELVGRFTETKSPSLKRMQELQLKLSTEGLTTKEILEIKRIYEQKVKTGYLKDNNSVAIEKATNIDDAIREDLIKIADESGFDNFRDMSKEIQLTKNLLNSIQSKEIKKIINNQFSLTDNLLLIGGAIEPASLGVLGVKKLLGAPSIQAKIINAIATNDLKSIKGLPGVPKEIILMKNAEKRQEAFIKWLEDSGIADVQRGTETKMLPGPTSIQAPAGNPNTVLDNRGEKYKMGLPI